MSKLGVTMGSESGRNLLDQTDAQHQAWLKLPKRMFWSFLAFDGIFVAVYLLSTFIIHLQRSKLFLFVNLDAEANPPAWYSGIQLFVIAIVFFVLWSRLIPERQKITRLRPLWLLLGIGFTYLSADEIGQVHEQLSYAGYLLHFNVRLGGHALLGERWEWLYLVVGVVLLIAYWKQLALVWRNWRSESIWFVLGFALLFFGTFIMEAIHVRFHHRFFNGWHEYVEVAFEEGIEMLGATVLLLPAFRVLSQAVTLPPDAESADAEVA